MRYLFFLTGFVIALTSTKLSLASSEWKEHSYTNPVTNEKSYWISLTAFAYSRKNQENSPTLIVDCINDEQLRVYVDFHTKLRYFMWGVHKRVKTMERLGTKSKPSESHWELSRNEEATFEDNAKKKLRKLRKTDEFSLATISTTKGQIFGVFDLTNIIPATNKVLEKCGFEPTDFDDN